MKKQTSYTLLLLETISLRIEIMAIERVIEEYMLKVQEVPSTFIDILGLHGYHQIKKHYTYVPKIMQMVMLIQNV